MNALRVRVFLLTCWLAVFFGVEPLLAPVHIHTEAAILALGMLALALGGPALGLRLPLWLLLLTSGILLVAWELLNGSLNAMNQAPLAAMEVAVVMITSILAHRTARSIGEFETAVARITIGRRERVPEAAEAGAGALYREVRRARNHGRPLALMAVSVDDRTIHSGLDRLTQQAQAAMMKQYALAGVSKLLCDKLEDCDVVVQQDDAFLTALPETTPEDLPHLVERLRRRVADEVGVDLKIGVAFLGDDGFTLDGLVQKATHEMKGVVQPDLFIDLAKIPVKSETH